MGLWSGILMLKRIYLKSSRFNALYKLFVKIYCDVNIDKWWIKAVYKYWILFYQRKVMDFKAAYIEIYCEMNDVKNMKRLIIWWIYKYWNILWLIEAMEYFTTSVVWTMILNSLLDFIVLNPSLHNCFQHLFTALNPSLPSSRYISYFNI